MSPRKIVLRIIAVWVLGLGFAAEAQINGFGNNGTNWTLNTASGSGSTPTIQANFLQLVDSGDSGTSAFYDTPQYIGSFAASFTWQNVQASAGAGFTFCLQNQGTNAVGQVGGNYLGFYKLTNATGIAFNVLSNSAVNPGLGYAPLTVPDGGSIGYTPTVPVNFDGSDPIFVQIGYTNGVLDITVTDTVTTNSFSTSFTENLSTAAGGTTAFVGFTGGGVENLQVIITNFVFTPFIPPIHQGTYPVTFTNGIGNIDVSKLRGNETDPSITCNPSSNAQMFIAANMGTDSGLFGAYSRNGGTNWTTTSLVNLPPGTFPVVAWDGYTNLFMAYADGNYSGIDVAVSFNGGQSFTFLTNLATGDFALEPKIAVGQGAALGSVWVLYKDYSLPNAPLVVQGAEVTNFDGFDAFGPPELVPGSENGCGFGDIAVGPQGQVLVVYQTLHDSPGVANDFVCVDPDGLGPNLFGQPVLAATNVVGGNTLIPAASNGQGINGASALAWDVDPGSQHFGNVYLITTGEGAAGGNDTDIFLSSSANSGATWTPQARVNDNTNRNSHFLPRVAVDQSTGILAMSWYDCRLDLGQIIITNFVPTNIITTNITTNSDSTTSTNFSTNMMTNVVITTNLNGTVDTRSNDDAELYATLSLDGGASIQSNMPITGDTTNGYEAALAVSPTDFGNYTGLVFCQGVFYPVWADNSGSSGLNPDGANKNFDIMVAPTVLKGLADVSVTQIVTNTTNILQVGSVINYFITVSNAGPTAVTADVLTDTFPPGVNVILAFPTNNGVRGNYVLQGNVLTWSVGTLGVGKIATMLVRATAAEIGQATNVASISPGNGVTDLNTNNNVSFLPLTINAPPVLAFNFTGSPAAVAVGQQVTFNLSVTNLGPLQANAVTITNTLPPNLTFGIGLFSGPFTSAINGNQVVFSIGTLTNLQAAFIEYFAVANSVGYNSNVAVISSSSVPTNNTLVVPTLVADPNLELTITPSATNIPQGQMVSYTLSVNNIGPVDASGVAVTDTVLPNLSLAGVSLPPGVTYSVNRNSVVFNIGGLAVGQGVSMGVIAQALASGAGTNSAVVESSLPNGSPALGVASVVTPISSSTLFSNLTVVPGVTSAFITWNTASNSTSQVLYGLTSPTNISYYNPALTNRHVVLLTGLAPDSTYQYQARSVTPPAAPGASTNGSVVTIMLGGSSLLYVTNSTFTTTSTLIFGTADASYGGSGWTVGASTPGIFTGPDNNEPYYNYVEGVTGNPTASASYIPNIPVAGLYDISVWYPIKPASFANSTPMIGNGATNAVLVDVDQTANGGGWNQIITGLYFATGTAGNLTIYNNSGSQGTTVVANGARWVYETNQDAPTNGSVPAWWANFYFGHPVNGSDDTDGGGYSNYADFVLGTDPTLASSQLQFQVTPASLTSVAVSFAPWQGGRLYQLQSSTNLVNPNWITLTNTPVQNTNDGSGTFTVRQTGTNTFYRLSATLLPNQ